MRARKSRSEWLEIIEAFERSGRSHTEFCASRKLELGSFRSWLYRVRQTEGAARPTVLLPVEVSDTSSSRLSTAAPWSEIVVGLGGLEVRFAVGTDVGYVASLVAELRTRC